MTSRRSMVRDVPSGLLTMTRKNASHFFSPGIPYYILYAKYFILILPMLSAIKKKIPQHHPLRLLYHKTMAVLAALYYRFPGDRMTVIGVTGTKGKTTATHLIAEILRDAGNKVGFLTTADFRIDEELIPNEEKMTTLPPFKLQRYLRLMADHGCQYAVVEVTSHALDQSRLWGVAIDIAVSTNVAHEHLDYHGTMENYLKSKGKLFSSLNYSKRKPNIPKMSVINADDASATHFQKFVVDRTFLYGIAKGSFCASDITLNSDSSTFTFKVPNDHVEITLPLPGQFNIENALAAATVGVALQINLSIIKRALEKAAPVPGRMEPIREGQKYSVIVDYAHTPDSLEKMLGMFRPLTPKLLMVVFGATGDRDRTKRVIMGEIVHRYADWIVLTDDDPYTEDPLQIVGEVKKGIPRKEGENFWIIPDRREAIRVALAVAREGDTVIVAGKGCEPYQVVGDRKIPSDDRLIVRGYLSREVEVEIEPGKVQVGNRYLES